MSQTGSRATIKSVTHPAMRKTIAMRPWPPTMQRGGEKWLRDRRLALPSVCHTPGSFRGDKRCPCELELEFTPSLVNATAFTLSSRIGGIGPKPTPAAKPNPVSGHEARRRSPIAFSPQGRGRKQFPPRHILPPVVRLAPPPLQKRLAAHKRFCYPMGTFI